MLAGRNVGLFVGVLTMGGKRWRRNDPNEMTGKEGARGENEPTSFSPSPVQCKKPPFVSFIGCLRWPLIPVRPPQIGYRLSTSSGTAR